MKVKVVEHSAKKLLKGEREYEVKRLIDCRLKGEARPDYILSPSTGKLRPSPPASNRSIGPIPRRVVPDGNT
jgi:hypothetical protein